MVTIFGEGSQSFSIENDLLVEAFSFTFTLSNFFNEGFEWQADLSTTSNRKLLCLFHFVHTFLSFCSFCWFENVRQILWLSICHCPFVILWIPFGLSLFSFFGWLFLSSSLFIISLHRFLYFLGNWFRFRELVINNCWWIDISWIFAVLHTNESINLSNLLLHREVLVHHTNLQLIIFSFQEAWVEETLKKYILLIHSFFSYVIVHQFVDEILRIM